MGKKNKENIEEDFDTEEMTVELDLENGTQVTCAVVTILTVAGKDLSLIHISEPTRRP